MLIDPDLKHGFDKGEGGATTGYYHAINTLVDGVSSAPRKPRVAVCVTKCDLYRHRERASDPAAFAQDILGPQGWSTLVAHFGRKNVAVFATSAVGLYPDNASGQQRPNIATVSTTDGAYHRVAFPGVWKPFGVLQPIEWLLNLPKRRK